MCYDSSSAIRPTDLIHDRDLEKVAGFLEDTVSDPSQIVELSRSELLDRLGWTSRLTYLNVHDFPDPTIPYREIKSTAETLRVSLEHLKKGYLVLLGDPGSGKSTLLTRTLAALPHRVIRYYAFVPDSPSSRALRGESTSFLHDLTLSLDRAGFRAGQSINDPRDLAQLSQRFQEQLRMLHENWQHTGTKTVLLVDGLDHIPRELKPRDSLLKYLPDPDQVPDGILFALGSQTDQLVDLPHRVHESIQHQQRRIKIERLSRESVSEIITSARLPVPLTGEQQYLAEQIVAGHPLALALLLNRLSEMSNDESIDAILLATEPFSGHIDAIYHGHWRHIIEDLSDVESADLLAKLARIRPTLDLLWIETWAGSALVDRLRRSCYHLFRRESRNRWHLFHNSFRQFLLRRTAETPPDGFDEERDRRHHLAIADICARSAPNSRWSWEESHHRLMASQHQRVLELASAERLRSQLLAFRPIDSIVSEIKEAITAAGVLGDFLSLVRVLLLGVEFSSRDESLSNIPLHQLLLDLGEAELACLHARDGRQLRIGGQTADAFSLALLANGFADEAQLIFELAEPYDLLKPGPSQEQELTADRVSVLQSWANTAVHFRPLTDIVRLIRGVSRAPIWDRGEDKGLAALALQNCMLSYVGFGLLDEKRWNDLDQILAELDQSARPGKHEQFWLREHAWRTCLRSGEIERAKAFVHSAAATLPADALSDSEKVSLAEGYFRAVGDIIRAKELLTTAALPQLANELNHHSDFGPFEYRLRYHRMLYALGDKRRALQLIPYADLECLQGQVFFERAVSEIARLWAAAWTDDRLSPSLFVDECTALIRLFYRDWNHPTVREQWGTFSAPRHEYFSYLISVADLHGPGVLPELANAFEVEWFEPGSTKYWGESTILALTVELVSHGINLKWGRKVVERFVARDTDEDLSGRVSRLKEEAEAFMSLGDKDRARQKLVEMLRVSAGIGYRKDYQLDSWIDWMEQANRAEPTQAEQRISFLSSAIISMVESTEGRATVSAAEELLGAAFRSSPVRAVKLVPVLCDNGAISFADAATVIVKCVLRSDSPCCRLALEYCCECLIPISTSADGELVAGLVNSLLTGHGKEAAGDAAKALLSSVEVLALPETRDAWRSGIARGIAQGGLNPADYRIETVTEGDDEPTSLAPTLQCKDGRKLASPQVGEEIRSTEDLLRLMESEASGSYFNWTPFVARQAALMNREQLLAYSKQLRVRYREANALIVIAERLLELHQPEDAWQTAMQAAEQLSRYSSDRFADNGPAMVVFELLRKIDVPHARGWALDSLVKHLTNDFWWPYGVAVRLDRIAPMICEPVPILALWGIIENYLKALFANVQPLDPTLLRVEDVNGDTAQAAMARLLCCSIGHPAHVLSEGAIRACVDLLLAGNNSVVSELQRIMETPSICERDVGIILDVVSDTDPSKVQPCLKTVAALRQSLDQSIRWSGERIAARLGMPPIPERPAIELGTLYSPGIFVPKTKPIQGKPPATSFEFLPDAVNVADLVSPWENEIRVIAGSAGLQYEAVAARVATLMKSLAPEKTWNREAEQDLRRRMKNARVEYPFRRLRFAQARRAVFTVLAELVDARRISDSDLKTAETMFRTYDPNVLTFRPSARPREIDRVACPQYNDFKRTWVTHIDDFDATTFCRRVGDQVVIAEKSMLKPSGTGTPTETRMSVLCATSFGTPSPHVEQHRFFPSLTRETILTYYECAADVPEFPALEHNGWGYDTPGDGWLAFNPTLASALGWHPCPDRLLAWTYNGQPMVQTMWWADGVFEQSMPYYRKLEVGEGWLVLASPDAMKALKFHLGATQFIVTVKRQIIESDYQPFSRTIYRTEVAQ
jgi:energy-coupling factor transporter ATP-binding protein EcfA2